MVVGRFLQGVGGGGLVPATLALVADLYPVERRGVPLGVVSAVQELGSVLGPLFGAVVLAVADWRVIFLINLAVGLVLAAAIRARAVGARRVPRDSSTATAAVEQARSAVSKPPARLPRRRPPARRPSSPASLVFVQPAAAAARPHLGAAVHPVRRRRPLADPARRDRDRRPPCSSSSAAAPPSGPLVDLRGWGAHARRGRPGRRAAARGRARRRDPRLRDRRPRGPGVLRPGLAGTSSAPRSPPSLFVLHLRRAEAPLRAPRRAAAYPGLGRRCWSASSSAPP